MGCVYVCVLVDSWSMNVQSLLDRNLETSRNLAIDLYTTYSEVPQPGQAIRSVLGISVPEANNYLAAGRGFCHPRLGPVLKDMNASVHTASTIVKKVMTLHTGEHRLDLAARLLKKNAVENQAHAIFLVNKVVNEKKKEQKQKEAVKVVDIGPVQDDSEVQVSTVPMVSLDQIPPTMTLRKKSCGKDRNEYVLSGVRDSDAAIFDAALESLYAELPAPVKALQKPNRNAVAFMVAAHRKITTDSVFGRVTVNFVLNEQYLEDNPEKAITYRGRFWDLKQVQEAIDTWGTTSKGCVMVHDINGRVMHQTRARLASFSQRTIGSAQFNGCAAPHCSEKELLQYHHITPWAEEKTTDIHKMIPLCRRHHAQFDAHPGGVSIDWEHGIINFTAANGVHTCGLIAHPGSTILNQLAQRYGYDPYNPQDVRALERHLIRLSLEKKEMSTADNT